jgi:hypothetical protein
VTVSPVDVTRVGVFLVGIAAIKDSFMRQLLVFTIFLFSSTVVLSAVPNDPREMADALMTALQKGDIAGGFDRLFVGSSIPQAKPQAVELLKSQTQMGLGLYGKIQGFELLKEEKHGTSLVKYLYILKSEKAPTIWEFYFYKPVDSWFLVNIVFNDQFNLLH